MLRSFADLLRSFADLLRLFTDLLRSFTDLLRSFTDCCFRPNKASLDPVKSKAAVDRNRTKAADHIYVKRHDGYAAAEKRRQNR